MSTEMILDISIFTGFGMVLLAMFLSIYRLYEGPNLVDRVLSLDLMTIASMGIICLFTILTGIQHYVDIAIALALVAFLATVAFAFYVQRRGLGYDSESLPPKSDQE